MTAATLIAIWVACIAAGVVIGARKGEWQSGLVVPALLGPFGLLIVAGLQPKP